MVREQLCGMACVVGSLFFFPAMCVPGQSCKRCTCCSLTLRPDPSLDSNPSCLALSVHLCTLSYQYPTLPECCWGSLWGSSQSFPSQNGSFQQMNSPPRDSNTCHGESCTFTGCPFPQQLHCSTAVQEKFLGSVPLQKWDKRTWSLSAGIPSSSSPLMLPPL